MHTRRLITFLLGVWFALILTIAGVATTSFKVKHEVGTTAPEELAGALRLVGEPRAGQMFRYAAAEINRTLFEVSGVAELCILLIVATLLLLQNHSRRATILACILLVAGLASHFLLTPQIVAQGRILDFRAADMLVTERARFAKLHTLYGVLTVFRLLTGAWVTGIMLLRGPNSRLGRRKGNTDAIDNTENSHIDG